MDRLAGAGVSPDVVTLAAVPVAALGGVALIASPGVPALLLLVPFLVALRLFLNLIDGHLARRTGRTHARGELFNEVGDRVADVALLAPVAFLPGAQPETTLLGVAAALLASYVGVAAKAAGGERIYRGILSKPGRMILLAVFCVLVFTLGPQVLVVVRPAAAGWHLADGRGTALRCRETSAVNPTEWMIAILLVVAALGIVAATRFRAAQPARGRTVA